MKTLITGGAGFIGSRLARRLLKDGYSLRILDSLNPQVHGAGTTVPDWMARDSDVRVADISDREAVRSALEGVEAVVHLAAETGPAQSMYEIERYTQANVQGTATLLQEMLPRRTEIRRLVVASSRAVYGEGKYHCAVHGTVYPEPRLDEHLSAGRWEPVCPVCGEDMEAVPTDEDSLPKPTSLYAVTKLAQEQMCLVWGRAYGVATRALRYQNVYGPGQSLTNPYIGVLAIFAARIKSGSPLQVYEDGRESRDFVHVEDVVRATALALSEGDAAEAAVYNVGSGQAASLYDVAVTLAEEMGREVSVEVTGRYRVGDIRHCYADLRRAVAVLGYTPQVSLRAGLRGLAEWTWAQESFSDELDQATRELAKAGLYRESH